jgi:hypothetical protein
MLFLLVGSVVGCAAGLFAGAGIGSAGLALDGALLFNADLRQILAWDFPWPMVYIVMVVAIYVFTVFGAYFVTGWVSAWCTTRIGEWGKNRNVPAPALLSCLAGIIPSLCVCACFADSEFCTGHKSPLEDVVTQASPLLASWFFSNPFSLGAALLGFIIAPATASHFAVRRVLSVKFCERCNSFMRVSEVKELTLGRLRALVRAVRKGRLDVAASLLHGPSWGDGQARLYCCRRCPRGYFEVTVTYAAHWKAANPLPTPYSPREPTQKSEAWLAVSCELAETDTERLRQVFHGITQAAAE